MSRATKIKKRRRLCRVKNQPRGLARIKSFISRAARCIAELFKRKKPNLYEAFQGNTYQGNTYTNFDQNTYIRTKPEWSKNPKMFPAGFVSENRGLHWDRKRN